MKNYKCIIFIYIAAVMILSCNRQTRIKAISADAVELTDSCKYCSLLYATIVQVLSTEWYNDTRESFGQGCYVIMKDNLLFDCPDRIIDERIKIKFLSSEEIINNKENFFFYYKEIQMAGDRAYVVSLDCRVKTIVTRSKYKLTNNEWVLIESSNELYRANPFDADDLLK